MKRKQVITLIAISVFSGYLLAQEKKAPSPAKSININKVQTEIARKTNFTEKVTTHKSLNPDKPDFVGVPAVITDPNRP